MAVPDDKRTVTDPVRIPQNTQSFQSSSTGSTSGTDYAYSWTTFGGSYEILNTANSNVSGPVTNPNFPTFSNTQVLLNVGATTTISVVNAASGLAASAVTGYWGHTTTNISGGFEISGNIYTPSAGELYTPVTGTAVQGVYTLADGTNITLPHTINTGIQQFSLMSQPGPWPAGIAANTSGTIAPEIMPVFATLGSILQANGAGSLESLSWNFSPVPTS